MSTIARPDPMTATDAEFEGYDAARSVETIARKLRELADDLEQRAVSLLPGDGRATWHASQIVSEYTQQVGSIGGFLSGVVQSAGSADAAHRVTTEEAR